MSFRTIAHWVKALRQILADVAGLDAAIRSRLIYGVLRRVESQVLAGDGTGENLRGILATTGIGATTFDAGVPLAELPLAAMTDITVSNATPNAVVLNPTDWQTMVTAKAAGSGDYYYGAGPFNAQVPTVWGLPAVLTPVMPAGTAL